MELVRISLPYVYVLGAVLVVFAVLGFKRSWVCEAATLLGVLAVWMVAAVYGVAILSTLNRLVRIVMFIFQGGMDSSDASAIVRRLNDYELIRLQNPQVPTLVLFVILALVVYWLAWRTLEKRSHSKQLLDNLVGALLGVANGFVITSVALQMPSLQSRILVSVSLPTIGALSFAREYTSGIAVALVGLVIAFALLTSIRSARRREDPGWAERGKARSRD